MDNRPADSEADDVDECNGIGSETVRCMKGDKGSSSILNDVTVGTRESKERAMMVNLSPNPLNNVVH